MADGQGSRSGRPDDKDGLRKGERKKTSSERRGKKSSCEQDAKEKEKSQRRREKERKVRERIRQEGDDEVGSGEKKRKTKQSCDSERDSKPRKKASRDKRRPQKDEKSGSPHSSSSRSARRAKREPASMDRGARTRQAKKRIEPEYSCDVCRSTTATAHSLAQCGHMHCSHCLKRSLARRMQGSKKLTLACHVCQTPMVTSDLIACGAAADVQLWLVERATDVQLAREQSEAKQCKCTECGEKIRLAELPPPLPLPTSSEMENHPQAIDVLENIAMACHASCGACGHVFCRVCQAASSDVTPHFMSLCPLAHSCAVEKLLGDMYTLVEHIYCSEATLMLMKGQQEEEEVVVAGQKKPKKTKKKSSKEKKPSKSGVGFDGTLDDACGEEVEMAMLSEDKRREKLAAYLTLLSGFLQVTAASGMAEPGLTVTLRHSCLVPVLLFFLRNDWLMEISSQDSALYFTILVLLRTCSNSHATFFLLLSPVGRDGDHLWQQLQALHQQTSIFLKQTEKFQAQEDEGVANTLGLALDVDSVVSHIRDNMEEWEASPSFAAEVASLCLPPAPKTSKKAECKKPKKLSRAKEKKRKLAEEEAGERLAERQMEEAYVKALKPLQFGFLSPPYRPTMYGNEQGAVLTPQAAMRLSQELSSLASSLPLSINSGIFLRVWETEIHHMVAVIIGPAGTPYENGCFEFEIDISFTYPQQPPKVLLVTTKSGAYRFNPNLYANGKVCLSLLGTWPGPGWDPAVSSLMQVLVSIQSLIMVPDPYFNEPGFMHLEGTKAGREESAEYNQTIRRQNIDCMALTLANPPVGFEDVIHAHFYVKQQQIMAMAEEWQKDDKGLEKYVSELREKLAALEDPFAE